jgi:putative transposase
VDFVRRWSDKTEIGAGPRDFWLEDWEKQAIIGFHLKNPLEGYRRLTFMMLDADIVAVSPTSVWRVLSQAGLLSKWNGKPSKKGTGFEQPLAAHQARHRCFVHQHQRDVLLPVQHSRRVQPLHRQLGSAGVDVCGGHRDHLAGSQGEVPGSAAPDHLRQRASVHCQRLQGVHSDLGHDPRQNFALLSPVERKNRTLAQIAQGRVHPAGTPLSVEDARRLVQGYVEHYNNVRLNRAIGYITPQDMLAGRRAEIHAERDRKLEEA